MCALRLWGLVQQRHAARTACTFPGSRAGSFRRTGSGKDKHGCDPLLHATRHMRIIASPQVSTILKINGDIRNLTTSSELLERHLFNSKTQYFVSNKVGSGVPGSFPSSPGWCSGGCSTLCFGFLECFQPQLGLSSLIKLSANNPGADTSFSFTSMDPFLVVRHQISTPSTCQNPRSPSQPTSVELSRPDPRRGDERANWSFA